MQRLKIVLIALGLAVIFVLLAFFVIGLIGPQNAGLAIQTDPPSMVFINNEQVGRTPYEETRDAGEITLKLVPESFEKPLVPYETKLNLAAGVKTIVQQKFAETEDNSGGVIVSFEKEGGRSASIAVVSLPDAAEVKIDGKVAGFTPHKSTEVEIGEHTLTVSASGYEESSLNIQTHEGHKLTAFFKLVPDNNGNHQGNQEENTEGEENDQSKKETTEKIRIKDTPTGFLRVRSEPSTLAEEVAQVKPGEEYLLLDRDDKTGWYKIEYETAADDEPALAGWVSNQYTEKIVVEESSEEES